jgi:NPCBM/NEW2 domain
MIRLRFALIALFLSVCGPAWADELTILNDKSVTGALEKISDSGIVLQAGGKPVFTPLAKVLELTLRPANAVSANKFIEVQLTDDSVLRCTKATFSAKEATLELTSGATVKVPLSALLTVLRDAQDGALKREFDKLLKEKKNRDGIFILKAGNLNPLYGTLGAIDEAKQSIKFKPDNLAEIDSQLEKIQGLQFTRVEAPTEPSLCKVFDVDGNRLVAAKLSYSGGPINITTPFGHKVALDIKAVARIDFNFGRLTYLSDLEEKSPDAVLLGGFNPLRKDTNLDGDPIMLDKKYEKGLSMYAGTELEYNLGGKYKDFKAILGVDARIAEEGQGKVTVTIYCDREKRGEHVVSAKAPVPITINVKDAQSLRIVVSGTNFTNLSGHATLANAHVSQ